MKKIAMIAALAALGGCTLFRPLTPEEVWNAFDDCWSDAGVAFEAASEPIQVERLPAGKVDNRVAELVAGGYVKMGEFNVNGSPELDDAVVETLGEHLHADRAVWSHQRVAQEAGLSTAPQEAELIGAMQISNGAANRQIVMPVSKYRAVLLHRQAKQ